MSGGVGPIDPHRLRRVRKAKLLTQEELASKSGVSLRSLQDHEARARKMLPDRLVAIAEVLGVEANSLFIGHTEDLAGFVGAPYTVAPATWADLATIARMSTIVYEGIDVIPLTKLREWYSVSPAGFCVVRNATNQICGNLDVLPLRGPALQAFLAGEIIELDITSNDLISDTSGQQAGSLYVESLVALGHDGGGNSLAVLALLMNAPLLMRDLVKAHDVSEVFAISASKAGTAVVKRLGFRLHSSGASRKDKHEVYVADYAGLLKQIVAISRHHGEVARLSEMLQDAESAPGTSL